jgi:ubiquinone/menaquinone biosynthesis C-methylase UbiE
MAAPRVGELHCVDASDKALDVARSNLAGLPQCRFHLASVSEMPFEDGSMDFGYSLGVLHHTPDTAGALAACARKLKPGAPFLVYLYYAFDNRPPWFQQVWKASDVLRRRICHLPFGQRRAVTDALAATVYLPLARGARALERLGFDVDVVPLSSYRDKSFYTMRNDALDRFGTRLEQRFSRAQINEMMQAAGLADITFREGPPYWCAVGRKAR